MASTPAASAAASGRRTAALDDIYLPPPSQPRSVLSLLESRRDGQRRRGIGIAAAASTPWQFYNGVVCWSTRHRTVLRSPRIVVPVDGPSPSVAGRISSSISSLDASPTEGGRFLLAGQCGGSVLLYDLSKWGATDGGGVGGGRRAPNSDEAVSIHEPVAQASGAMQRNNRIISARWFPVDSGAFLTASFNGNFTVWDSDRMEAVATYKPYPITALPLLSMEVSKLSAYLAVVSCGGDPVVKLVDIRSGASAHSLVGHRRGGVPSVHFSPVSEYVLASGGGDSCVRMWDIRKAGSRACITILDKNNIASKALEDDTEHISRPYREHYANLRAKRVERRGSGRSRFKKNTLDLLPPGPNDYHVSEGQAGTVTTMDSLVRKVVFTNCGQFLVACGNEKLSLWDLRRGPGGYQVPRRFVTLTGSDRVVEPGIGPAVSVTDDCGGPTLWIGNEERLLGYSLFYSAGSGKPDHELRGHLKRISAIAVDRASIRLVTAAFDRLIMVWGQDRTTNALWAGSAHAGRNTRKRKQPAEDRDNW